MSRPFVVITALDSGVPEASVAQVVADIGQLGCRDHAVAIDIVLIENPSAELFLRDQIISVDVELAEHPLLTPTIVKLVAKQYAVAVDIPCLEARDVFTIALPS